MTCGQPVPPKPVVALRNCQCGGSFFFTCQTNLYSWGGFKSVTCENMGKLASFRLASLAKSLVGLTRLGSISNGHEEN